MHDFCVGVGVHMLFFLFQFRSILKNNIVHVVSIKEIVGTQSPVTICQLSIIKKKPYL